MPSLAQSIHHISDEMLQDAPLFGDVVPRIAALLEGAVVLAHNAPFDVGFLQSECLHAGSRCPPTAPWWTPCTSPATSLA